MKNINSTKKRISQSCGLEMNHHHHQHVSAIMTVLPDSEASSPALVMDLSNDAGGRSDSDTEALSAPPKRRRKMALIDDDDDD